MRYREPVLEFTIGYDQACLSFLPLCMHGQVIPRATLMHSHQESEVLQLKFECVSFDDVCLNSNDPLNHSLASIAIAMQSDRLEVVCANFAFEWKSGWYDGK